MTMADCYPGVSELFQVEYSATAEHPSDGFHVDDDFGKS